MTPQAPDPAEPTTIRSPSGYAITPVSPTEKAALAATLTAEERRVLLNQGTEPPFCGTLLHNKAHGVYTCRLCGLPLFRSGAKFESGTGWPSFAEPFDPHHLRYLGDDSHSLIRTEIRCARCDAHLGHVFEDGPPPSGKRFCLNSLALEFTEAGTELPRRASADRPRKA
jgi:peptide-methionine (R)-S-oxide reductase